MKKQLMTLAALAAIAAGCSNDDENIMVMNPDQTQDTPISLTANVAGLNATRTITDEGKLVDATLGLFVTTQNVNNSRYTATNMLWTGDALGNWTSAATVLYEGANSTQTAYAYAPHSADYDATAGTVAIDLATQTDYLYAAPTALTGSILDLSMVHRLSKLTVDITGRGTEVAANDNVAAISLANLPTTATWALADNTLTLATTTGTVATGATDYTALVLPGTESFSVIVTMESGRIFKSAVTAPTGGLASGTAYTVSLKVGKDKVTMGEVSVTDWAEENIPGGEAEEVAPDVDASTMTADEVKAKVAELLKAGDTSITVKFAPDTQAEMHKAVIEAIGAQATTGAVISSDDEDSFFPEYTIYPTFADAVTNWTDGTTLTLLADVPEISEQIEISGNALVLDLNGKSMTSTISNTLSVTGGELTIRDSVGTGSFTTTGYTVLLVNEDNAVVNFENGTLHAVRVNRGTFNMTGGKIYSEKFNGIDFSYIGTVNISGGEVTSTSYDAIANLYGTLTVSGTAKITSTNGYAIYNTEGSVSTTISGDVVLSGSKAEFYLYKKILLNSQPTGGTQWKVKIDTSAYTEIENGIFATPGEGVTLDPANFASAMDGYEVQRLEDGSLALVQVATE